MPLNRRSFLKLAATTTAGLVALPRFARAASLESVAPSNRIAIGVIGVGGQGGMHLQHNLVTDPRVQVVAVCDVDTTRRNAAKALVEKTYADASASGSYKGCFATGDFRELIDRADVDAVLIAVNDHWHALPLIYAARAGKDIYAEKPLSLTIPEGKAMVKAVEESGVVCQIGSQQRSSSEFQRCVELARNGFLGDVKRIRVGLPHGAGPALKGPLYPQKIPEGFDYEFWLGPAPWAPYCKERCSFDFRWVSDYSGGQLTDWIGHHFDIGAWGGGVSTTGPVAIKKATAHFATGPLYNTADDYAFEAHYANGLVIEVSSRIRSGTEFIGSEGSCWADRGRSDFSSPTLRTAPIPSDGFKIAEPRQSHWENFFSAVASRQPTRCPIQEAHRVASVAHLANIAFRSGHSELAWDPLAEEIIGAPDAQRLVARSYRSPWQLPV